jgi:hypothetical protein
MSSPYVATVLVNITLGTLEAGGLELVGAGHIGREERLGIGIGRQESGPRWKITRGELFTASRTLAVTYPVEHGQQIGDSGNRSGRRWMSIAYTFSPFPPAYGSAWSRSDRILQSPTRHGTSSFRIEFDGPASSWFHCRGGKSLSESFWPLLFGLSRPSPVSLSFFSAGLDSFPSVYLQPSLPAWAVSPFSFWPSFLSSAPFSRLLPWAPPGCFLRRQLSISLSPYLVEFFLVGDGGRR